MSDSDSFIEEVSEEVRRERLYGFVRRYGWIAILAVLAIVAGAAYTEYSRSQAEAEAQSFGDALLDALETEDPAERAAAITGVETPAEAAPIVALLAAAEAQANEDTAAAANALRSIAEDGETPQIYRDLAGLKLALLGDEALPEDERKALLERLATPGAPFRPLALEQLLYITVQTAEPEEAIEAARTLLQEPEISDGLRERVSQVILALGGEAEVE
ncbi:tetratricopeptide repeat protein [Alphaproteobacteria bacterium KMM 3653]|uniref:Tetratricopeptide repeat protein n=1 Tax=Harenicola maris TaxID=2841044 RepID=A0AAP2G7S9_9RHOB|nr:tetratricopeptide repeat protein [Harenicola maris]